MMERLSRIGFHRAHKKYRDIEMFHELCDYQDTELSPADIIALKSENERLREQLERAKRDTVHKCWTCTHSFANSGNACYQAHYTKDYSFCLNWQWRGEELE